MAGYNKRFKEFKFIGALAVLMKKYVDEKRALGRLFNKQSQMLVRVDKLSIALELDKPELTRELVECWIELSPNESRKNQRYRLNFIKLFGKFMIRLGYKAYIPTVKISSRDDAVFVPYIFTKDELKRIFQAVDNLPKSYEYPNAHLVYPVLFRILYCCGLRVSEAVNLKVMDVDLQSGVLRLESAKHNKQRYVPMSADVTEECRILTAKIHQASSATAFFFPNARNNAHHTGAVYWMFRELLRKAGISHGGKGNGPRLHDLRHTFSVHCLQRWENNGVDLNNALPYLSAYLGHKKLTGTQKYLRLTAEAHKNVVSMLEAYADGIIPKLKIQHGERSFAN